MTDRPPVARLCPACASQFCPIDQPRCSACSPGRGIPNNTRKRATPKPPPLPDTFEGISLAEAIERYGPPVDDGAAT